MPPNNGEVSSRWGGGAAYRGDSLGLPWRSFWGTPESNRICTYRERLQPRSWTFARHCHRERCRPLRTDWRVAWASSSGSLLWRTL